MRGWSHVQGPPSQGGVALQRAVIRHCAPRESLETVAGPGFFPPGYLGYCSLRLVVYFLSSVILK
jgi:hypothetical protein